MQTAVGTENEDIFIEDDLIGSTRENPVNKVIPNINDINLDSINSKDGDYSFRLDSAILRPKPWAMVENKGDD